ncbi:hypothetical protein EK21DRAFT_113130 [Setomelanomma holmii]|uniref:Protein kinase domain-containing protein n=1 Tax=Setomelanomma holmii TaxID=210430 RepID=A0A9P4LJI9_9PLEO|nr:hypothetical protein EK21DRAFT_113130 [Setomelanomma holmii]
MPSLPEKPLLTSSSPGQEKIGTDQWKAATVALRKPQGLAAEPYPTIDIPRSYTKIANAGSWVHGDAYFCVPTSDLEAACSSQPAQTATQLMSKLQVVKVNRTLSQPNLASEVALLKAFQMQRQFHTHYLQDIQSLPFFDIVCSDTLGSYPDWYASTTLPLCLDIKSLMGKFYCMSEEFVWLIYTQLHSAITFIDGTCIPALAHADLHMGNVVIGYDDPEDTRSPQVKLIDFGLAQFAPFNTVSGIDFFRKDDFDMLRILRNMLLNTHQADDGHYKSSPVPKTWSRDIHDFHEAVEQGLSAGLNIDTAYVTWLWARFSKVAQCRVECLSEAARKGMRDVMLEVGMGRYVEMEKKVDELLTQLDSDFTSCTTWPTSSDNLAEEDVTGAWTAGDYVVEEDSEIDQSLLAEFSGVHIWHEDDEVEVA